MDANGDGLEDIVASDVVEQHVEDNDYLFNYDFHTNLDPGAQSIPLGWSMLQWSIPWTASQGLDKPRPEFGMPIDYDRDGRSDLLLIENNRQYETFQILLTRGSGNGAMTFQPSDTGIPSGLAEAKSIHLADVTGDGVSDLIFCRYVRFPDIPSWEIHPWVDGGFQVAGIPIDPINGVGISPSSDSYPCKAPLFTADVNADGKANLLYAPPLPSLISPLYIMVGLKDALDTGWTWEMQLTNLPSGTNDRLLFTDVNGDGLADAVQSSHDDFQTHVNINTGSSFTRGTTFGNDTFALSPLPEDISRANSSISPAHRLQRRWPARPPDPHAMSPGSEDSPGSSFNRRASWPERGLRSDHAHPASSSRASRWFFRTVCSRVADFDGDGAHDYRSSTIVQPPPLDLPPQPVAMALQGSASRDLR